MSFGFEDILGSARVLAVQQGEMSPAMRQAGDAFEQEAIKSGFMERYSQAIGKLIVRQQTSIDELEAATGEPASEYDASMLAELKTAQYAEAYTACRVSNFAMTGRIFVEAIRLRRLEHDDGSVDTGELPGSRAVVGIMRPGIEPLDKTIPPFTGDDLHFALGAALDMRAQGFRLDAYAYDSYTLWAANENLNFRAP